jgi:DNA-binding transcriptional LysR family regulator
VGREDDLNWDDLRYFLRAVEARTMAGAARAMGVERTTVGRRLTALEQALGAPLVLRNQDGLELTPLGQRLVPLAAEVERAVRAVKDAVTSQNVRVRLAMPSGFPALFMGALDRLYKDNPGLSLEILSGSHPVDLARGEADLAIRSGPIDDQELVARRLFESDWSLYASEGYLARHGTPASVDELEGHQVIGFDPSFAGSPQAQWLEPRARKATTVVRGREVVDLLTAAVNGAGIALLPCLFADAEPTLRRLTAEVTARRTFSLVYRREARLSPQVQAVMRFVTEVLAERTRQTR